MSLASSNFVSLQSVLRIEVGLSFLSKTHKEFFFDLKYKTKPLHGLQAPRRAWLLHIFSTTCNTITLILCFNHNGFLPVLCLFRALLLWDLVTDCFWFLHIARNLTYVLHLNNYYFCVDLISAPVSQKHLSFSLTLICSSASWILLYYYWQPRVNFIFLYTYYSYH